MKLMDPQGRVLVVGVEQPERLAAVAGALSDIREGRVRQLSDDDLAAYDG